MRDASRDKTKEWPLLIQIITLPLLFDEGDDSSSGSDTQTCLCNLFHSFFVPS